MGVIETRRYCSTCGRQTRHVSQRFSPEAALLLAILTAGLFLIMWFFISIGERHKPWVCCECSERRHTSDDKKREKQTQNVE